MTRIDDYLNISNGAGKDYHYTADQVIAALSGAATTRVSYPASYFGSANVTVFYTALDSTGLVVLTARTSAGVQQVSPGFYVYHQPVAGSQEFLAVWDEGDPAVFAEELIVVAP